MNQFKQLFEFLPHTRGPLLPHLATNFHERLITLVTTYSILQLARHENNCLETKGFGNKEGAKELETVKKCHLAMFKNVATLA